MRKFQSAPSAIAARRLQGCRPKERPVSGFGSTEPQRYCQERHGKHLHPAHPADLHWQLKVDAGNRLYKLSPGSRAVRDYKHEWTLMNAIAAIVATTPSPP